MSERWKGAALLLPALVLAWPGLGSPGGERGGDFLPHATGAGAAALAAIPAALLSAWRPGPNRPRAFLWLPLLGLAAAFTVRGATDSFEVRRVALHFATSLVLFFGGASLAPEGLRVFARGAVLVALLLLAGAHLDADGALAGALGNTGSTAMAALPGAAIGAALLVAGSGAWRVAGGAALLLDLAYAVRAPVLAAAIALAAGLAGFALARRRVPLAALALAAGSCAFVPGFLAARAERSAAPASASATGGLGVRRLLWSSSLRMLADHPWAGVGAGQFAARFPPYRDPREIELSTHGRKLAAETEVEHPHEDWLFPALELGAPLGLAWIAFLAFVAAGAWRAMRGEDPDRAALGAASIGILAYATVHAPLTYVPASAAIAFASFGAVLARPGKLRTWPIALLILAASPLARAYVRHGSWLAELAREEPREPKDVERAIESALNCCHDSPLATAMLARLHEETGRDPATVARAWEAVLVHRPHNVEALMQLGLARARAGELAPARAAYERALALDPAHPGIARNLRLLDLQEGRLETGRPWLAGEDPIPEVCFARAKQERDAGDRILADLFEARAHLLWAREHAALERFGDAVRSYRQCVRVTGDHVDGGAVRVRLELAAALAKAGRVDEAKETLGATRPTDADRESLPGWAADALLGL